MRPRLLLPIAFLLLGILLSGCSRRSVILDVIENDDIWTLRRLLKEGGFPARTLDEKYYYRNGYNALQYACFVNRPDCVLALLEHGVDPNRLSVDGRFSPLLLAVAQNNSRLVKILLAHGALPDLKNSRAETALHFAASIAGEEEVIRILLAGHANAHFSPQVEQSSPIDYAVMFTQKDNLKLLLELCSVDREVLDRACNWAAMRNYLDGVRILLDAGADVNYVSKIGGDTALHYAVYNGNADMQRLLVSKGARLYIRNGFGLTPYEQEPRGPLPGAEFLPPGK